MAFFNSGKKYILAALIFHLSFLVYLTHLCPTIYLGDTGELITAAATLGVPQPPGYPLYCLLGRLFSLLPLGSLAFRINLMSAAFGAAACAVFFLFLTELFRKHKLEPRTAVSTLTAWSGTLLLAFSLTFWGKSLEGKSHYIMNAFFFILVLSLSWRLRKAALSADTASLAGSERSAFHRKIYLLGFVFGLGLASHQTLLFTLPVPVLALWSVRKRIAGFFSLLARAALFLLLGLGLFLYVYLRALHHPALNWGDPSTFRNLLRHLSPPHSARNFIGASGYFFWLLALLPGYARDYGWLALQQTTPFLSWMALPGLWLFWKQDRRWALITLLTFLAVVLGNSLLLIGMHYNAPSQSYPGGSFFLPSFILLILWSCFVLDTVLRQFRYRVALLLAFALPFLPFMLNRPWNDLSRHFFAYDYGKNIFRTLPRGSLLDVHSLYDSFSVVYLVKAEHQRPDLTIYEEYGYTFTCPYGQAIIDQPASLAKGLRVDFDSLIQKSSEPCYTAPGSPLTFNSQIPFDPSGFMWRARTQAQPDLPSEYLLWQSYNMRDFFSFDPHEDLMTRELKVWILERLAYFDLAQNRMDLSDNVISNIKEIGTDCEQAQLIQYNYLVRTGKTAGLLEQVKAYASLWPASNLSLDLLAYVQTQLYHYLDAEKAYLTLNNLYLPKAATWTKLGTLYLYQMKWAQAAESFQKALALEPANIQSMLGLGFVKYKGGQQPQAKDIFDAAIALDPKQINTYLSLGNFYANEGLGSEALFYLSRALALDPKNAQVHLTRGSVYFKQREYDQAGRDFQLAVDLSPGDPAAWNSLGSYQQWVGQKEKARVCFQKSLALQPDQPEAQKALQALDKPPQVIEESTEPIVIKQ